LHAGAQRDARPLWRGVAGKPLPSRRDAQFPDTVSRETDDGPTSAASSGWGRGATTLCDNSGCGLPWTPATGVVDESAALTGLSGTRRGPAGGRPGDEGVAGASRAVSRW